MQIDGCHVHFNPLLKCLKCATSSSTADRHTDMTEKFIDNTNGHYYFNKIYSYYTYTNVGFFTTSQVGNLSYTKVGILIFTPDAV